MTSQYLTKSVEHSALAYMTVARRLIQKQYDRAIAIGDDEMADKIDNLLVEMSNAADDFEAEAKTLRADEDDTASWEAIADNLRLRASYHASVL